MAFRCLKNGPWSLLHPTTVKLRRRPASPPGAYLEWFKPFLDLPSVECLEGRNIHAIELQGQQSTDACEKSKVTKIVMKGCLINASAFSTILSRLEHLLHFSCTHSTTILVTCWLWVASHHKLWTVGSLNVSSVPCSSMQKIHFKLSN